MIAQRTTLDMDEAFRRLRNCARDNNRRLTEVAEAIAAGALPVDALAFPPPPAGRTR